MLLSNRVDFIVAHALKRKRSLSDRQQYGLARLRLRPTSPEVAPIGHQKHYTSVIVEQAAGG